MKVELPADEHAHLERFTNSRPGWETVVLEPRVHDESDDSREHKYPKPHPYITGMKYVLEKLRGLAPCKVLDIGSPLTQNVAAACIPGVEVCVVDVRPHSESDHLGLTWRVATATALPYENETWDVLTSLWVMGHVGDGRYGDALRVDGDIEMLSEIARVLRPGGIAILGPGLVDAAPGTIYNLHRIYTWEWLREQCAKAGFEILEEKELAVSQEWFIADGGSMVKKDGSYALLLLRKR